MRHLVLALALFFAPLTHAQVVTHPCTNVVGYSDYTSAGSDLLGMKYASAQVVWSGFTGTLNASFKLQVSDNAGSNWEDKSGTTLSLATTAGNKVVSMTNVTEQFYRLLYLHGSVTGGTVNCYLVAKP